MHGHPSAKPLGRRWSWLPLPLMPPSLAGKASLGCRSRMGSGRLRGFRWHPTQRSGRPPGSRPTAWTGSAAKFTALFNRCPMLDPVSRCQSLPDFLYEPQGSHMSPPGLCAWVWRVPERSSRRKRNLIGAKRRVIQGGRFRSRPSQADIT